MRIGRRGRQGDSPRRGDARNDSERISAIAHDADVSVEDVLRDVAEFRLALETDMIVAAAAADAEAPELLSEMLDGERAELADFHDRLLERLVDAAAQDELAARRSRRAPLRPTRYVAAAAAVLALAGLTRMGPAAEPNNRLALATASQQYADLSSAVTSDSRAAMTQAAAELHETLATLISEHAGDPEVAQQAATLLQAEISLLQDQDPAGASQVIAQAHRLMTLLRRATPPNVRASVAPILDAVQTPRPSSSPKPSPKPSPTSASPKPTSSPKPTATPSPSASQTDDDDSPLHTP